MEEGLSELAITVRHLREGRGWSLANLAARAGVDPTTIWKIEHGKTPNPGHETLTKISGALGVELSAVTGVRPLPRPRVQIFEGVARVPIMRVRVQASGRPTWDDTRETIPIQPGVAAGRPNLLAAVVSGECMTPTVEAGDTVIFDPDSTPQHREMVVVTDDEGATMVKWYRIDELGRPFLRAADGTTIRPNGARLEGVVIHVIKRALRDPQA